LESKTVSDQAKVHTNKHHISQAGNRSC